MHVSDEQIANAHVQLQQWLGQAAGYERAAEQAEAEIAGGGSPTLPQYFLNRADELYARVHAAAQVLKLVGIEIPIGRNGAYQPEVHDLITISAAATLLGVTTQAVSGRIARGDLIAVDDPAEPNPQRRRRVSRTAVEALRHTGEVTA